MGRGNGGEKELVPLWIYTVVIRSVGERLREGG